MSPPLSRDLPGSASGCALAGVGFGWTMTASSGRPEPRDRARAPASPSGDDPSAHPGRARRQRAPRGRVGSAGPHAPASRSSADRTGGPAMPTPTADSVPAGLPQLRVGAHLAPEDGACLMEYVSVLSGARFSDHPPCTDPMVATVARMVNDASTDAGRPLLAGFAPDLAETGGAPDARRSAAVVRAAVLAAQAAAGDRGGLRRAVRGARRRCDRVTGDSPSARLARSLDTVHRYGAGRRRLELVVSGGGSCPIGSGTPRSGRCSPRRSPPPRRAARPPRSRVGRPARPCSPPVGRRCSPCGVRPQHVGAGRRPGRDHARRDRRRAGRGRALAAREDQLREPFGILQAALVGFVGLLLAFGLTMAVGRYEARRAAVVQEANDIGTTSCGPRRCPSRLAPRRWSLLKRYGDAPSPFSDRCPAARRRNEATIAESGRRSRPGCGPSPVEALTAAPVDERPPAVRRDAQRHLRRPERPGVRAHQPGAHHRVGGSRSSVPPPRSPPWPCTWPPTATVCRRSWSASLLVTVLLLVTFDLDRPTRGLIRVPATPLQDLAVQMTEPVAATGP